LRLIGDIRTESGRQYVVDHDGFVPDSRRYIDRAYTFDCIPDAVLGHTHIRTAGDDKMIQEDSPCMWF